MAGIYKKLQPTKRSIIFCTLIVIIYILLIYLLPDHSNSELANKLSSTQYKHALLLSSFPSIIVWLLAFYAYSRIEKLALSLKDNWSHRPIKYLSLGYAFLAWSLPLSAVMGRVIDFVEGGSAGAYHAAIIASNYIELIVPLIGFLIIYNSTKTLIKKNKNKSYFSDSKVATGLLILGVAYCYAILSTFKNSSITSTNNNFHLPLYLLIITLFLPYLYAWFIGLITTYDIYVYSSRLKGIIYKRLVWWFSAGQALVIFGFILLQLLRTKSPTYGTLELNSHLIINLLIRLVIAIGFCLITYGANKLIKIEEI